jgi:DNA-binding response OmpR family regulator
MTGSVLIVDDSLTVRMDLTEAFEAAGFRAIPCAALGEAREALTRGPVDIVILDVLLPDGDGVEFLKEIRDCGASRAAAVMMLSTEAEVKDRIRGLQCGADEYVGKPYEVGYLVARAREFLRSRHSSAAGSKKVLVIDDSATLRDELTKALEPAGYIVLTAASGEEGLRVAADRRPDAVVVDGMLPGIDGATVIRRVRLDAALRGIPCLLLTGSEDKRSELRALDAGADAFMRKEEGAAVILARLAAVLRGAASTKPAEVTASLLGPKKILAVDDSMTYLQGLADALRGEGYDVILAHTGEEALELLAVQSVDCILLDLLMPGMGGQETCRRIKTTQIVRDVPLIMLTSMEDRSAMIQGLGAGADDYISKASEFEVLKARVRAQIRRKQFEDENRRVREELLLKEMEAGEARAARELAEARAVLVLELERKNKELEAFSYSVSHDLRAPLRSIDGFSQILLKDCAEVLDAQGMHHLQRVRAAAQRMGDLIDDLLQLSRVGRGDLSRSRVNLSGIARTIATELGRNEPERMVKFDVPDELFADADNRLIKVALENLLGNAWKFTSKIAGAKIEFGAEQRDAATVYFVRDNGAGFNMDYADKLFSPFQRLHRDADFPGTGIGLATVYRIFDRHGGRVWAEGAVGKGATFYFTITSARLGGPS